MRVSISCAPIFRAVARSSRPASCANTSRNMIENDGRDDSFEPRFVVDSDLPRAELAEWLRATRAAQLRRLSNEALSDVKITNSLLLALSFRSR